MKPTLENTSTITLAFLVFLIPLFVALAPAEAEEPPRFREVLRLEDNRPELAVEISRPADGTRRQFGLTVETAEAGAVLCRTTLPREVGASYYQISVEAHQLSRDLHVMLLNIESSHEEGPLDPPRFQVVFGLQHHSGASRWRCSVIARGERTELDGGPLYAFAETDEESLLTRREVVDSIRFCGLQPQEEPTHDVFDLSTMRFAPATSVGILSEQARRIQARLPEEPFQPPHTINLFTWTAASSDIRGAPAGAAPSRPLSLGTQNLNSPWIEGSNNGGSGEFVTASVNPMVPLRGLRIAPGHLATRQHFMGHAQPREVLIGLSDGTRFILELPEHSFEELREQGGLLVEFPEPQATQCLSVMLLASTPGHRNSPRRNAVAIAEVTPISTLDDPDARVTARQILAAVVAEDRRERRDRIAELGGIIDDEIIEAIDQKLRELGPEDRQRILPLLGLLNHELSLPVLREHYLRITEEDADFSATKRAIAVHGPLAAPFLIEIVSAIDMEERRHVDSVRLLGRVGRGVHLIALLDHFGEGPDFLRRERIRAIAAGGLPLVPALITRAEAILEDSQEARLGAVTDTLTTLVFVGQRFLQHEATETPQANGLTPLAEPGYPRSLRRRAIESLGYFYTDEGTAVLLALLSDDPDPLIRSFAAEALRLHPSDEARHGLEAALDDDSPDVRIAAARTLNRRDDASLSTAAVATYIEQERWPRGIHHAALLLARSPEPEAGDALAQMIHRSPLSREAATAMRALRREERPLPLPMINALIDTPETPNALLRQLVDMLAMVDDTTAEQTLIALAASSHVALNRRDPASVRDLSHRALLALGLLGTPRATEYLLTVVFDGRREEGARLRALRGLAFVDQEPLAATLEARQRELPEELRRPAEQTINQIRNRLAIDDAGREIQTVRDAMQEADRQRNQGDDEEPVD